MVTIGSLFSGIGGLELGLEWAGLGPVLWQVEIDPFCRAVLAKHWPHVERFEDVAAKREYPAVDLLCGGFPCTDVSSAGKRRGLGGQSSGLWYHFARIVRELRPSWVVVENVASGASRWLRPVRHQLHLFGYRTRALGISAADCGAPHRRSRVFVLAHAIGNELRAQPGRSGRSSRTDSDVARADGTQGNVAYANGLLWDASGFDEVGHPCSRSLSERHAVLADDYEAGRRQRSDSEPREEGQRGDTLARCSPSIGRTWASEPAVGRVAHGVSGGLAGRRRRAQLRAIGNAVVPQCAQVVGEVIRQMLATARPRPAP